MIRSTALIVVLFWTSTASADWQLEALWDWAIGTANPKLQELEDENAALQARVDELEGIGTATASAQVRTALDLLPYFQQAVARIYRETGVVPESRIAAALSPNASDTQTNFISGVDIDTGVITFTFGNGADPLISGLTLSFTPYESADQTISWRCADEPQLFGTSPLGTAVGGPSATYTPPTIPPSTYPVPCIIASQSGDADDLIRAQVLESLPIAATAQAAVEEYFANTGQAPASRTDAGLTVNATDTVGNYIESLEIVNGTITLTFGNRANAQIFGQTVSVTPYESADLTIFWRCGYADQTAGTFPMGTSGGGNTAAYRFPTLEERHLPFSCLQ